MIYRTLTDHETSDMVPYSGRHKRERPKPGTLPSETIRVHSPNQIRQFDYLGTRKLLRGELIR